MPEQCEKAGITVVDTDFQHNDMRDTGPDAAKTSIQTMLDKFLDDTDSDVAPVDTKNAPKILTIRARSRFMCRSKKSAKVRDREGTFGDDELSAFAGASRASMTRSH